jgi:hypothetical protein
MPPPGGSKPTLVGIPVSVEPHDRTEGTPFKPAYEEFMEIRIIDIAAVKSAYVRSPPGNTRQPHIESCNQLISE